MQQPLYDVTKRLVPPWRAQEEFRKGTLVLVEANLNIHHFPSAGRSGLGHSVSLQQLLIVILLH